MREKVVLGWTIEQVLDWVENNWEDANLDEIIIEAAPVLPSPYTAYMPVIVRLNVDEDTYT